MNNSQWGASLLLAIIILVAVATMAAAMARMNQVGMNVAVENLNGGQAFLLADASLKLGLKYLRDSHCATPHDSEELIFGTSGTGAYSATDEATGVSLKVIKVSARGWVPNSSASNRAVREVTIHAKCAAEKTPNIFNKYTKDCWMPQGNLNQVPPTDNMSVTISKDATDIACFQQLFGSAAGSLEFRFDASVSKATIGWIKIEVQTNAGISSCKITSIKNDDLASCVLSPPAAGEIRSVSITAGGIGSGQTVTIENAYLGPPSGVFALIPCGSCLWDEPVKP